MHLKASTRVPTTVYNEARCSEGLLDADRPSTTDRFIWCIVEGVQCIKSNFR